MLVSIPRSFSTLCFDRITVVAASYDSGLSLLKKDGLSLPALPKPCTLWWYMQLLENQMKARMANQMETRTLEGYSQPLARQPTCYPGIHEAAPGRAADTSVKDLVVSKHDRL